MRRRIPGFGRAAIGGVAVLLIAWAATTIYTLVKERETEGRIARIERAKPTEVMRACLRMPRCRRLLAKPASRRRVQNGSVAIEPPSYSAYGNYANGKSPTANSPISQKSPVSALHPAMPKPTAPEQISVPPTPAPSHAGAEQSSGPQLPAVEVSPPEPSGPPTSILVSPLEVICTVADRMIHLC